MAKFIYPTDTTRVTSGFRGNRPDHHGIDLAEAGDHPIYAAASGQVSSSYPSSSYGECIMIVHTIDGVTWETVYAHMRSGSRTVKAGDYVTQGQTIGVMGNTGQSSGQHLHFELHKGRWNINKSNAVNPLDYLGKEDGGNTGNGSDPTDVDTRKNVTLPSDWLTNNLGWLQCMQRQSWVYKEPNEFAEVVGKIPLGSGHVYLGNAWDGKRFWFKIANDNWIPETAMRIEKDGKSKGVIWNEWDGLECYHHANYNSGIRDRVGVGQWEIEFRDNNWIYIKDKGWVEFDEKIIRWIR
ncbi:M23 family metallopeptidase [Bacillus sp. 166amftsu]|uniref:M23 family metallopeptidase n=1 Tax=Bacillus sp. 166amftsu TaxID=1761753 RepID=UPI0008977C93|nr:M23 family metallopeptidase [Bacillus sp. 166amftsu]SDY37781.1 Peptidase family M23 [Bacillus sp. 166amftsu]